MEWNDETIGRLRAFWAEGLSTAEIGRRLGVTKNAVVGKAHRLNLSARPSPIRRATPVDGELRAATVRRVSGSTLPPLGETPAATSAAAVAEHRPASPSADENGPPARMSTPPASEPRPEVARPMAVRSAPFRSSRTSSCCWPIGEPGTKNFRFCSGNAAPGKPYCQEHVQLAYVKVRDRREEAAA